MLNNELNFRNQGVVLVNKKKIAHIKKTQNIIKQNIIKQNIIKQNIIKQNIIKQNIIKQKDTLEVHDLEVSEPTVVKNNNLLYDNPRNKIITTGKVLNIGKPTKIIK